MLDWLQRKTFLFLVYVHTKHLKASKFLMDKAFSGRFLLKYSIYMVHGFA